MQSKRFTLNQKDYEIIKNRTKEYLIPLLVIYIPFVIANIEKDGFQLHDFYINQIQQGALMLFLLNRIYLPLQLFVQGKK